MTQTKYLYAKAQAQLLDILLQAASGNDGKGWDKDPSWVSRGKDGRFGGGGNTNKSTETANFNKIRLIPGVIMEEVTQILDDAIAREKGLRGEIESLVAEMSSDIASRYKSLSHIKIEWPKQPSFKKEMEAIVTRYEDALGITRNIGKSKQEIAKRIAIANVVKIQPFFKKEIESILTKQLGQHKKYQEQVNNLKRETAIEDLIKRNPSFEKEIRSVIAKYEDAKDYLNNIGKSKQEIAMQNLIKTYAPIAKTFAIVVAAAAMVDLSHGKTLTESLYDASLRGGIFVGTSKGLDVAKVKNRLVRAVIRLAVRTLILAAVSEAYALLSDADKKNSSQTGAEIEHEENLLAGESKAIQLEIENQSM